MSGFLLKTVNLPFSIDVAEAKKLEFFEKKIYIYCQLVV